MTTLRIALLLPLLVLSTSCGLRGILPQDPPASEGKLEVKEISLGRVGPSQNEIRVSPDQRRVALKITAGGKERVLVDGKPGPDYDTVTLVAFSPDSQRVGYLATRNGRQFVVIDGAEGKAYEAWDRMYFRFSPDSRRVAFRARIGASAVMVIDGVEGKPYKSIGPQEWPDVFSPDSKRTAYAGEIGGGPWATVVDGVEGKPYRSIDSLQFSPDSRRVLYEASRGNAYFVVVDGIEDRVRTGFASRFGPFQPGQPASGLSCVAKPHHAHHGRRLGARQGLRRHRAAPPQFQSRLEAPGLRSEGRHETVRRHGR